MTAKTNKPTKKKKVAVVIFNLGGPDSKNAIKPFLMNFFMDKNIIRLPVPFRCILAWMISTRRSKCEAGESYGELKDKSPLLENTQAQAKALEKSLKGDDKIQYKTFICMRYWHPMSAQTVREVRDWNADEILILPLYPQFSTTTTGSSLQAWDKAMFQAGYERPTSTICCYPFNKGFITASAENIQTQIDKAKKDGHKNPRILFSAHGLPEDIIKDGDPYQWQCEQTAEKIATALKLKPEQWTICYQSKVGPKKWIGPSLDEELERAATDNVPIVIYPHAFTQEHVETLVELDIEYEEMAEELGIHGYYRAATVSTHPKFIDGLKTLVQKHTGTKKIIPEGKKNLCPAQFSECCMRKNEK